MIGAGLSPTGTAAGAVCAPRRTTKRPARARRAAAASSHGGRESGSAVDSGAVCSSCATEAPGIDPVVRTSGRATGWALERSETGSGATTVAATGWAGRRRLPLRFVETVRAARCRAARVSFSAARLAPPARRDSSADGMAAGARPWSDSVGDVASSSTFCPPKDAGCDSGAGAPGPGGAGGAGTAGVSRGGSSVIGST
jgi:hypothetical protein